MQSSKQSGFGVVEAILILVVIGILGFVGWSVYNSLQQTDQSNKAAMDSSNQTINNKATLSDQDIVNSDDGYVIVKKWGVKFKLTDTTSKVLAKERLNDTDNPGVEIYDLTTEAIDSQGSYCAQESGFSLAALSRSKTLQDEMVWHQPKKQIGEYYYYYNGSQSTCSSDATKQANEVQAINKLYQSLESLELSE